MIFGKGWMLCPGSYPLEDRKDLRTGELTEEVVKRILTNSQNHPHGIKVMHETGDVVCVKQIHTEG